jgi:hypothetical protein
MQIISLFTFLLIHFLSPLDRPEVLLSSPRMTQAQGPSGLFKRNAHGLPYLDDILMVAIIRKPTITIQYFKPLVR